MNASAPALLRALALIALLLLSLLSAPFAAQAHPGHDHPLDEPVDEFAAANFAHGVTHPFTGMDHLVAALAAGCLAFSLSLAGRTAAGLIAAGTFLAALSLGYFLGRAGVAMPLREAGLALSVVALGAMLLYQHPADPRVALGLMAGVAFWHGNAHGVEGPGLVFGAGLLAGTALVVALGAGAGWMITRWTAPVAIRFAGATVAVAGLVLCGALILG